MLLGKALHLCVLSNAAGTATRWLAHCFFQNPGWPSLTSLPKLQRATPRLTLAGPAQPAPVFSVPAPSCGKRYLSEAGLWDADAVDIHRARLMS